jgi:dethiobiotin synthase
VARGLFVTGTDTGVGKTVVSAALMCLYRRRVPVRYWKPIQTGIEHDDDTAAVARLAGCAPGEIVDRGVRLRHPVSPHRAAELAGRSIAIDSVVDGGGEAAAAFARPGAPADLRGQPDTFWVVEGAGGVLVPLNDEQLMVDLMARLALPAVVVARTAVGTINHTLLTIDALRRRRIEVAAVIMSGPPDAAARRAIEHHGQVTVAELPVLDSALDSISPAAVMAWADAAGASWQI